MRGRGVGAMFWLTTVDAPRLSIYVKVIARDRSLKRPPFLGPKSAFLAVIHLC